ncbi:DUF1295 domain-containing protein [Sinimarinibacterium sp. CAU 1509]|uniref:DUF1295 domain-containing protein n=1 Tax=Sinimarinibacterium sp. CAU 1509 TaxID=2562283 RepID=UPI0010ACE435|nr:DUF1295 domain-containing protein [Sinimarinibacterium sp. CAU 1509]TJY58799.1 DUF1295 domain-containing protein [Sinimarinibacterium sp. CAU 1509]
MGKTAVLLIATLILIPLLALKFDHPLSAEQWQLLHSVGVIMLCFAAACFVLGELTGNVSQVDKLWSITPVVYAWYLAIAGAGAEGIDPRMLLMAVLATVWGVRLTYNFSRHGGYSWKFWTGHEDYRWAHVRQNPGLNTRLGWTLFNLFFICLYQNALLLLIALPSLMVHGAMRPLGVPDLLLALAFLGLVVFEMVADQQQWNFQAEKRQRAARGEVPPSGFIKTGLWARSRHPNYFAEQSIWVVFFLFSVVATGRFNWSIAGCALLILLFQGSANLGERISRSKYPDYADYQRRVPRFVPRIF